MSVLSERAISVMNSHSIEQIQSIIDQADSDYYRINKDNPKLLDIEYDALKEALRHLDPNDIRLSRVGCPYDPSEIGTKTNHNIPMGSLDNTDNGISGYDPWLTSVKEKLGLNNTPSIMASLKIDGASICASYKEGVLQRVVTRGNGECGEDITANAVSFAYLPSVLQAPLTCEVRGEVILYKNDFFDLCRNKLDGISNPRNVGNGIIGRHDGTDSDKIRFLAFNFFSNNSLSSEEEKLAILTKLGFTVVPHKLCHTKQDLIDYYNDIVAERDDLEFEIDGIVVVLNNIKHQNEFITSDPKSKLRPKFARAIKFDIKMANTIVTGITKSVGHTGAIIPTMNVDTVRVGGVDVSNVLLNNWDEVKRFKLAIGDTVTIGLSGDIIPKLFAVVAQSSDPGREEIQEPSCCPLCNSATTRIHRGKPGAVTYCTNKSCKGVVFGKINQWVGTSKKGVGILDIGDAMLESLWDLGLIADPADLYLLTVDKLKDVTLASGIKIGESRATRIVDNITNSKKLSLSVFLGSLGIDLLGRRRVVQFVESASGKLDTLDQWLDDNNLATITFPGLGDEIRSAIRCGIDENRDLIAKLLSVGVVIDTPSSLATLSNSDPNGTAQLPLSGITMCWTGTRELLDEAQAAGAIVKSGVSKGLHVLVQVDPLSQTTKSKKAESYGTKVISVDYLRKLISGERTRSDIGL